MPLDGSRWHRGGAREKRLGDSMVIGLGYCSRNDSEQEQALASEFLGGHSEQEQAPASDSDYRWRGEEGYRTSVSKKTYSRSNSFFQFFIFWSSPQGFRFLLFVNPNFFSGAPVEQY